MENNESARYFEEKTSTIILIGKPLVGKGTQGKILGGIPDFHYLSMGDILRDAAQDEFALQANLIQGDLLDDETVFYYFSNYLRRKSKFWDVNDRKTRILIADGIPRTRSQARILDSILNVLIVIHIYCTDNDILRARLDTRKAKKNRSDDQPEVFEKRLMLFENEIDSILNYYGSQILVQVDGNAHPFLVHYEIMKQLSAKSSHLFQSNS